MWGNNCWAAILAVWTILAILRSGLARERLLNYEANYQEGKLGTNDGKAAYRVHESTRPTRNVGNYDDADFKLEDELPKLGASVEGKLVDKNFRELDESSDGRWRGNDADETRTTGAVATTVSPTPSSRDDANQSGEGRFVRRSFRENDDSSKLPRKELESHLSGEDSGEGSNNFGDRNQRRVSTDRSFRMERTDPISDSTTSTSIEISGDKRLSWISRGAIKKFLGRRNDAIHRNKTGTRMGRRGRKSERLSAKNEWGEEEESLESDDDDGGSGESDRYVEGSSNERSDRFLDNVDRGDGSIELSTFSRDDGRRLAVEKQLTGRRSSEVYSRKSTLQVPVTGWPENIETSGAVEVSSRSETEEEEDGSIIVSPTTSEGRNEFLIERPSKDGDKATGSAEGKDGTRNAKSLYDLMNNGRRVYGQYSPEMDENKSAGLSSNPRETNEAFDRFTETSGAIRTTTVSTPSVARRSESFDDAFDENKGIDGRKKRYGENSDEAAPGIEDSVRASAIHKSAEARLTEETYKLGVASSTQRSKVNIGKRKHNSGAMFTTSSTSIGSQSNIVELHSTQHPPPAWKKEISFVSRDTFVPSVDFDASSRGQDSRVDEGNVPSRIRSSNVVAPTATDNGRGNEEKPATLARIAGLGLTPRDLTAVPLAGKCGTSVTTDGNSNRIRSNSSGASNNLDRTPETAENCTRGAIESRFADQPVTEDSTKREGQNVSAGSLRDTFARERNATYLKRNMDKPLTETRRSAGSQIDASTASRFGAGNTSNSRNSSNSFGSTEVQFAAELKENELAKNPGIGKVGTTDADLRQLSGSGDSKKSKIRGDPLSNPFDEMIAPKRGEMEPVDETDVSANNRVRRLRDVGYQRKGPELVDGKESISLTDPSNVVREQGERDAENCDGIETSAAKFDEMLNGPPTNVPVIAFRDGGRISDSVSWDFLNQNSAYRTTSAAEVGDNESVDEFASESAGIKGLGDRKQRESATDNGGPIIVDRTERGTKNIKDSKSRESNNPLSVYSEYSDTPRGRKVRSSGETELSPMSNRSTTTRNFDLPSRRLATTRPVTAAPIHGSPTTLESPKIDSTPRTLDRLPRFATTDSPDRSSATSGIVYGTRNTGESSGSETTLIWPIVANANTSETRSSIFTLPPAEDRTDSLEIGDVLAQNTNDSREIVESGFWRDTDNSSHELEHLNQWPVKHSAVVEGELVLGGLMMVHEREDTITCGPVMPQGGVQALEAMLYTLDTLNKLGIVPGVKIGAHILDDCDKDTYGLEMAVDFIKGSISNIDGAEYHCNKTTVRKVISGVVGAASSVTSIQVANLLRLFRIPQVSFFSTSPELSNKQRFEYFTRTIPSDHYQVKAMVDIILRMGWSYVSIIYEESNYGIKAFEELEELLGKYDICIAIKEKLVKDSGVAEETAYDNIVLKLLTKPRARGCIIFGSDQEVAGVMRAVRRCNATGAFSWIGSDGWSARGLVSNGNEPEVEGTLSVQPQANPVDGFEEYFLNLTVENNRRNPWFVEFWEDHFQCRYPNASRTPYNQKYTTPCPPEDRLTKNNTVFEDQLQFVSDAVMAFGYAFRDMHKDLCHGKSGLCDAMKPTKGLQLLQYLRKVEFEGLSKDKFKFDKNGDGPARYNIIHFKQTKPGEYKWVRVGKYLEGVLQLNMSEIQFKLGHPQPPESVCSLPCEVGQAKKYVEGERCCWHCFNCTQYQIRHPKDETQCIPCRQGTVPDETHSACRDIPEEFLRPESGWAIGAMSFSTTGILITLFVCGVFLKHNDTPVVRASGRELSYVLLSGILLCYLVTFALVVRPTDIVCGIQRFTAGFCFTVVYAALLTKTNRISRIFNAGKHSAKRPSFISPRSQLIICSGLVFVQILVNGVWMVIDPARAMHHYPTRDDNLLVCNSYVDASYMIAFAYPIMLIVVCTVYAVLTRKIPEAFNESKHIGFTMYTTCVIWLAFVPLYFGTGNNVALRITSMSVTISLSASVTIACLFSPKLYIILIRPERNVRQSMMTTRYNTTKSSAVTATNASSMMAPLTLTAATCDQNKTVKKHIIPTIDCSTQSEYYELEVKDQKNGKPPTTVSRSTQTSNNEKDSNVVASTNKDSKDSTGTTKQLNNNARIGNGPVNQSDVPL